MMLTQLYELGPRLPLCSTMFSSMFEHGRTISGREGGDVTNIDEHRQTWTNMDEP